MFFKDFVSVKRQKIKRGASQTYDTPSFVLYLEKDDYRITIFIFLPSATMMNTPVVGAIMVAF